MLGGLNAIATLELFTQNYFIWDRISFTIWKRIKFHVYPPGARLSRPPHHYTLELFFFCKIPSLPRVRPESNSSSYLRKMCGADSGRTRGRLGADSKLKIKIGTPLSKFETTGLIYNYSAPGGWHNIGISHRTEKSKKLSFNSFDVQKQFIVEIIDWKRGLESGQTRGRLGADSKRFQISKFKRYQKCVCTL